MDDLRHPCVGLFSFWWGRTTTWAWVPSKIRQHGRFCRSNCFDDSCWLGWNFDMGPMPLEILWNSHSIHINNIQNNFVCDLGLIFKCAAPGHCCELELKLIWASTLATSIELVLSLLLYLHLYWTPLCPFHEKSWSYASVSSPHHPLLVDEKRSSALIVF